jgi:hypothetical protein
MKKIIDNRGWLFLLMLVKFYLQWKAIPQYGMHRDEFLYLDMANHPGWGYMEVPPFIAWIAYTVRNLLGDSIFCVKLLPAITGVAMIWLLFESVKELGGNRYAQILSGITFLVIPAFLRTHHLFQPVVFNQFWWFLVSYLIIRLVKKESKITWIILGIVAGLGFLTKYSIVFFLVSLLIATIFTQSRKWYKNPYMYISLAIAFLIALPNLFWQWQHQMPVLAHMDELARTQLVHVRPVGFLGDQFLMLFAGGLLWVPGLFALILNDQLKKFRILAIAYLVLIILLLLLSGKSYYTLGVYPVLLAAGAVWWSGFLAGKKIWLKYLLPGIIIVTSLGVIPYGIPLIKVDKMISYGAFMKDKFGLSGPLTWEDGKMYSLPQDYSDMFGWEEMAMKTANFYHSLPDSIKTTCYIWGGSYAHAGVLNFYKDKYQIPEASSFVGSYLMWIPDSIEFESLILVDDVFNMESSLFKKVMLVDSIQNKYAREPGYIYHRTGLYSDSKERMHALIHEEKSKFNIK